MLSKRIVTIIVVLGAATLNACTSSPAGGALEDWAVRVDIESGPEWKHPFPLFGPFRITNAPTYALWITDTEHRNIGTLFASGKVAGAGWKCADDDRPEALPLWTHTRTGELGLFAADADAMSGATPDGSSSYGVARGLLPDRVYLWLEINHSVDYNHAFPKGIDDPGDPRYSGGRNGSGQPALVYQADVDTRAAEGTRVAFRLMGHSEPGGAWRGVDYYADLSGVTTARSIINGAWAVVR